MFSSHTGHVKILEVNPSGKYVRLYNSSTFQVSEHTNVECSLTSGIINLYMYRFSYNR